MNKRLLLLSVLSTVLLFTGCNSVGDKSANVSFVYLLSFIVSLFPIFAYCFAKRKKEPWFIALFSAIAIVNFGYTVLAFSNTVESALWGNRIAYLGSAFLPIAMIMIFLNVTNTAYARYLPYILSAIAFAMFIIAASPGFSDIYYKEVYLIKVNGAAVLEKVYGKWHILYLYYLILTFVAMLSITIRALTAKRLSSRLHAVFLFISVFVNTSVWLIEQFVHIEFEMLSVSYIITELFLLAISFMTYENPQPETIKIVNSSGEMQATEEAKSSEITDEQIDTFKMGVETLTKTERIIFTMYTEGESTKSIMNKLNIKENTLKYHNKNIYGKLGVRSRKQLLLIFKHINGENQ